MARSAAKLKAAPKASGLEILDFPDGQGSPAWFEARLGLVTASNFHKVMAGGDGLTRTRYMRDLAGEVMTGLPAESYRNAQMDRGNEMEAAAVREYEQNKLVTVRRVGFVRNTGLMKYSSVGCSPDGLIDPDGGLECKSMIPALMIARFDKGATMPTEHRAQVQGCMWVCERKWWDVKIFYPGMPDYVVHVKRDEEYIDALRRDVETFCYDLKQLVERLRLMRGRK